MHAHSHIHTHTQEVDDCAYIEVYVSKGRDWAGGYGKLVISDHLCYTKVDMGTEEEIEQ